MRIISHSVSADLENLLSEYANLAHEFRGKSPQFSTDAEAWLLKVEATFKKYNFPEASKFARLSSAVVATRRGHTHNEKSRNPRSEKQFLSWQYLNEGQDVVHRYLLTERDKIEKAEGLLSQLVIIAFQKKVLDPESIKNGGANGPDQVLQILLKEQDLSIGILQMKSLVSQVDVLILLDKVLQKLSE